MRRFGVAIGQSAAWVVPMARGTAHRAGAAIVVPIPDGRVETLGPGLRSALGAGPARLDLVLLPGRYDLRWISLPPLNPAERRAVLERTLGRHLPGSGPWAFGSEAQPGGALVAAAPLDAVRGLAATLGDAGFRIGSLRASAHAWLAAGGGARTVLVACADRLELLHAPGGRLRWLRRLPRRLAAGAGVRDFVDRDPGPLSLIAAPDDVHWIEEALAGAVAPRPVGRDLGPEASAAAFAARAVGPEILTAEQHARRERSVRIVSRRLLAAAAGLALLAAGLAWWGTAREVGALRVARAAQSAAVAEALSLRERVTQLDERLAALDPRRGADRSWSVVLADLAEHLPPTAFLTAFRAAGDSVSLEGYARETGPVLESLRQSPAVAALRATAPIRREGGLGATALDRFVLGLRLAPRSAP